MRLMTLSGVTTAAPAATASAALTAATTAAALTVATAAAVLTVVTAAALAACTFDASGLGPPPGGSCGDGIVDTGEECDDGNRAPGDGCDSLCLLEAPCGPSSCSTGCCDGQGLCQTGSANGACGTGGAACVDCGVTSEICGAGGACEAAPPCTPGDTQGCGDCGQRLCDTDGEWGPCQNEGICGPGQVEQGDPCSYCGHLERVCVESCTWGGWVCEDQGVCLPGEVGVGIACGTCGHEERTCDQACAWGEYGCVNPDPVTYYRDQDQDSYGNPSSPQTVCGPAPMGYVSNDDDCDDGNQWIHPGALEVCGNCVDEDCDGHAQACDSTASLDLAPDPPLAGQGLVVTVKSNTPHTCVALQVYSGLSFVQYTNPTVVSGPPYFWIWNITAGAAGRTTYTFSSSPAPCIGVTAPVICRQVVVQ